MSNRQTLISDRDFQVWEYQVSHGHLLLRSPKKPASQRGPEQITNLDLHFWGVEYFELPRQLSGLEVVEPTPDEIDGLKRFVKCPISTENVSILMSEGHRFPVVCAGLKVSENEWDIFESPIEFRSEYRES